VTAFSLEKWFTMQLEKTEQQEIKPPSLLCLSLSNDFGREKERGWRV